MDLYSILNAQISNQAVVQSRDSDATPQGPAQFQGCRVSITVQTPREQEASPLEISRSATSISKLYFSMSRDLYKGWLSVHSALV